MANWYLGSNKHALIAQFATTTAYNVGDIVRQLAAPTIGNERAFRCTTAGTSGGAEPSWNLTKGSTTNSGTAVFTEVTGNSTYGWAAAAARINIFMNGASSWEAAGDTIYCHESHSESWNATINFASPGTSAAPVLFLSINDGETALTAGADFTRAAGGATAITWSGAAYIYGWHFTNEQGNTDFISGTFRYICEDCEFTVGGGSTLRIGINGSGLNNRVLEWYNVDLHITNNSSSIQLEGGNILWHGGSVSGTPTNLFRDVTVGAGGFGYVHAVDLSTITGNLVVGQAASRIDYLFENCKLNGAVTMSATAAAGIGGVKFRLVNCDSADTQYRYHSFDYAGTITSETVIINNATVSRKMVSSANSKFFIPLILDDIIFFNATVAGSPVTATVEIVNDGLTLEDDEIWLEVEHLGTSGFPLALRETNRLADPVFGTPAAHASSGATWVTTGLASPVKQKLEVTFTPEELGVIKLRVMLARPSTTVYVDPKVSVS